jgi:hypothetical protein
MAKQLKQDQTPRWSKVDRTTSNGSRETIKIKDLVITISRQCDRQFRSSNNSNTMCKGTAQMHIASTMPSVKINHGKRVQMLSVGINKGKGARMDFDLIVPMEGSASIVPMEDSAGIAQTHNAHSINHAKTFSLATRVHSIAEIVLILFAQIRSRASKLMPLYPVADQQATDSREHFPMAVARVQRLIHAHCQG